MDGEVVNDTKFSVRAFDQLPAVLDKVADLDCFHVVDGLALSGEHERILDDILHPVEGVDDGRKMWALAVLLGELKPALGDIQRVSEIMGDDMGKLLKSLDLAFKLLFALAALDLIADPLGQRLDRELLGFDQLRIAGF